MSYLLRVIAVVVLPTAVACGGGTDETINSRFGHVLSLDDTQDYENPRVA